MAKKRMIFSGAGVLVLLLIIGAILTIIFLRGEPVEQAITGFTPIYCNDYSFTCCVENLDFSNNVQVSSRDIFICPNTATRCDVIVTNWNEGPFGIRKLIVGYGSCTLSTFFVPGDRHICGNVEEQCERDADCGGHTYGNKECIGRNLQTYGCRTFGTPSYLEEYSGGLAYKPFEGDNDGSEPALSRCEIISAQSVQCCGDNDCGSNAFCDTTTWTCQQTAECNIDADCGVSERCDRFSKELKKPICSEGSCDFQVIQNVECCSSSDCPIDYFCDTDYTCKESLVPKVDCPFECCVGETEFFDRPCATGEFCIDNLCTTSGCTSNDDCSPGKICQDGDCVDEVSGQAECEARGWTWVEEEKCGIICRLGLANPTTEVKCVNPWDKVIFWAILATIGGLFFLITVVIILRKFK
jgi:hypothetical protein